MGRGADRQPEWGDLGTVSHRAESKVELASAIPGSHWVLGGGVSPVGESPGVERCKGAHP